MALPTELLHAIERDFPPDFATDEPELVRRTVRALAELRAASGTEFDRVFCELMITHHEGALTMVRDLFALPGAGQEPELFAFASDVEADQAMEIRRMRALLKELPE